MQRNLRVLGQGTNTVWNSSAAAASWYGILQGPFLQDAGYTNTTGNAGGAYSFAQFACVYSRLIHTVGALSASHPPLTTNVNTTGLIAASSPAQAGAGNGAAATPSPSIAVANPSFWCDLTDFDAIPAGQQCGLMQTQGVGTLGGPINPAVAAVCDHLDAGASVPHNFAVNGASSASVYIGSTSYSHLGGGSWSGSLFTTTPALGQDYVPNAFIASGLMWQTTAGSADAAALVTCAFGYSATSGGAPSTGSLHCTKSAVSGAQVVQDLTDFLSVPAGYYCDLVWTGSSPSHTQVGMTAVHLRNVDNNATFLTAGDNRGTSWTGGTTNGAVPTTTYTTFGLPRGDNIVPENMATLPAAGVFSNLSFQTGTQAYGGTPTSFTLMNQPSTGVGPSGNQTTGTITTSSGVATGWSATSLSIPSMSAASTWYYDLTDIAAYLRFDGWLNQVYSTANGSAGSVNWQNCSVNFTIPAHLGLTTVGAG